MCTHDNVPDTLINEVDKIRLVVENTLYLNTFCKNTFHRSRSIKWTDYSLRWLFNNGETFTVTYLLINFLINIFVLLSASNPFVDKAILFEHFNIFLNQ